MNVEHKDVALTTCTLSWWHFTPRTDSLSECPLGQCWLHILLLCEMGFSEALLRKYFTFTFSHLADLQCIHILHLHWWHTAHQELSVLLKDASTGNRTSNLLITKRLLYHCTTVLRLEHLCCITSSQRADGHFDPKASDRRVCASHCFSAVFLPSGCLWNGFWRCHCNYKSVCQQFDNRPELRLWEFKTNAGLGLVHHPDLWEMNGLALES